MNLKSLRYDIFKIISEQIDEPWRPYTRKQRKLSNMTIAVNIDVSQKLNPLEEFRKRILTELKVHS